MEKANWAIAFLACGTIVTSCSQAPPEPAPEFTLPLSKVSTAPASPEELAATASAPRQLQYIAVPPGQSVAGMAHARVVVKYKKATHHPHTAKKAVARPASVRTPTESVEPGAKP